MPADFPQKAPAMAETNKSKFYINRTRIAGGRLSNVYKCTYTNPSSASQAQDQSQGQIYALKVIDVDNGEVPPHSLNVEANILQYVTALKGYESNVIQLVDIFTQYDDRVFVLPFCQYTLTDYMKKHSRMKTNFSALLGGLLLGSSQSKNLVDPIEDYFENDDLFEDYSKVDGNNNDDDDDNDSNNSSSANVYQRINKINLTSALTIIKKIFKALAFLHANGIIHRDIKPDNILFQDITGKNVPEPVLIDFGISYVVEPSQIANLAGKSLAPTYDFYRSDEPHSSHKQTQISTGVYKPPEAILGVTDYAYGVDIWSFGIIITQLFSKNLLPVLSKGGNFSDIVLLNTIFKTFGTPNEKIWPKVAEIKYFQSFNFTQWPRIDTDQMLPLIASTKDEKLMVFKTKVFDQMMQYDENKRVTAAQALEILEKW